MTCRVKVYLLYESHVNAIVYPVMLQFPEIKVRSTSRYFISYMSHKVF